MRRRFDITGAAGAAAVLMVGRTVGFVLTFGIPLVLVRVLDQHDFGTYKYLFMLASTLAVLQLGMGESLYYFIPRRADNPGAVTANAVVTLAAIGAGVLLVMFGARHPLAVMLGQPGIAPALPLLGAFIALTLVGMPLEIIMVSRKSYRLAASIYAGSDLLRSALLILPGIVFRSLTAVLWGAVAFAAIRVAVLGAYLIGTLGARLALDRLEWRAQMAYVGPFAVAVMIETVQINLHQYVVWARSDPATFAIYAAGCLQIPLVDVLTTSVGNVMMVRMADDVSRPAAALALWHQAVERLAFWLWPLTAALILTAHDVIVLLFTARYAASVPVFVLSTFTIALAAFQVDSVLRVYALTRFLIVMNLARLAVVLAGIWWAMATFHLLGAIGVTVVGMAVAKALALWRMAGVLHVPVSRVLPWRALVRTVGLVAVAAGAVVWLRSSLPVMPPLLHGAVLAALYAAVYLACDVALRAPERLDGVLARSFGRVDRS